MIASVLYLASGTSLLSPLNLSASACWLMLCFWSGTVWISLYPPLNQSHSLALQMIWPSDHLAPNIWTPEPVFPRCSGRPSSGPSRVRYWPCSGNHVSRFWSCFSLLILGFVCFFFHCFHVLYFFSLIVTWSC